MSNVKVPKTIMITDPETIKIVATHSNARGFPGENPKMLSAIVREWQEMTIQAMQQRGLEQVTEQLGLIHTKEVTK
jgi:hypothetical protein|tara:strand:+ start:982 stop:1209 length:228 start_codon:yes stop_codon:yes gene_type:complete